MALAGVIWRLGSYGTAIDRGQSMGTSTDDDIGIDRVRPVIDYVATLDPTEHHDIVMRARALQVAIDRERYAEVEDDHPGQEACCASRFGCAEDQRPWWLRHQRPVEGRSVLHHHQRPLLRKPLPQA